GGVIFGGVLNSADVVQRLGTRVVQVEYQPVPVVVTQGDDEGVVVGLVIAIAHEQVEYLQVVIGLQTETEPIEVDRIEHARNVVVDEAGRVASGKTASYAGGRAGARRSGGKAGKLVFEPGLRGDRRWGDPGAKLRREGIVS